MKKFLITLAISTVVILGVWTVPESSNQYYRSKYGESVVQVMEVDSILAIKPHPRHTELREEITYATQPFDWQAFITWIIGSFNGVFGLVIMMKKVFGKNKL